VVRLYRFTKYTLVGEGYSAIIKINGPSFRAKNLKERRKYSLILLFYNYGKKSGFYSGILLDFEVSEVIRLF